MFLQGPLNKSETADKTDWRRSRVAAMAILSPREDLTTQNDHRREEYRHRGRESSRERFLQYT
jgi:hypothetical protein